MGLYKSLNQMSSDYKDKVKEFQKETPLFNPHDFNEGQHQVVGNCNGYLMEQRWVVETPVFRDIILEHAEGLVLDYGCGVGRLAKEVLDANDTIQIIGVDTSPEMLKLAKEYVNSERFETKSPEEFTEKPDFAYCVYVLQHVQAAYLPKAIEQITRADKLLLVNSVARMMATDQGFVNDGYDVLGEVAKHYTKISYTIPPKILIETPLMRKMFMGSVLAGDCGNTEHYAFIFSR
jgi:2-polyprenyl-3-methyl-5-hydroxy-6-metoxy-1,4-benzoquinol methylase